MVQLEDKTSVPDTQPQLKEWDTMRRKNYNHYEKLIQQKEFHLQKFQQSRVYSQIFPFFCQGTYLDLDILKKLQVLGDYSKEEVDEYSKIQPNIQNHLKNTFSRTFPYMGFALGICLLSHHLGLLVIPMISEQVYKKFDLNHKHNTQIFLESVINKRLAEANLEKDKKQISQSYIQRYQKNFGDVSLNEVYKNYLTL